jgi:hypothetical protein
MRIDALERVRACLQKDSHNLGIPGFGGEVDGLVFVVVGYLLIRQPWLRCDNLPDSVKVSCSGGVTKRFDCLICHDIPSAFDWIRRYRSGEHSSAIPLFRQYPLFGIHL